MWRELGLAVVREGYMERTITFLRSGGSAMEKWCCKIAAHIYKSP